jgi:Bacteriophage tail sheath protein
MPVTPTYPGVYIEELPSGVRTITGVPTSVTAFVGTAPRGPVNDPIVVTSFADYERQFGSLSSDFPMSYSVFQYYQNGGSMAVIVRLAGKDAAAATIDMQNGVTIAARAPGAYGNKLRARVDQENIKDTSDAYNLTVRDPVTGQQERYVSVSIGKDPSRRLDKMIGSSQLITTTPTTAFDKLPKISDKAVVGEDPFADPKPAPPPPPPPAPPPPPPAPSNMFFISDDKGANGTFEDDNPYGEEGKKTGLYALLKTDIFNLLVLPQIMTSKGVKDVSGGILGKALKLCVDKRAMLIADPPSTWNTLDAAVTGAGKNEPAGIGGDEAGKNAAVYFPRIRAFDREGNIAEFPPSGTIAGVYARTDVQRGVWKAPAGTDASLSGVVELTVPLTDLENGRLNPLGINCLRRFPVFGSVVWGARTMRGADTAADQWKYVPVRRLALFIEESLYRGTKWVVFEPNDEPLWSQIRLNIGAFMNNLFRQGAFQGKSPKDAYFVKCDKESTTQNDINLGIVNIIVGFAPLKPAEFVIIKIQQMAGQVEV